MIPAPALWLPLYLVFWLLWYFSGNIFYHGYRPFLMMGTMILLIVSLVAFLSLRGALGLLVLLSVISLLQAALNFPALPFVRLTLDGMMLWAFVLPLICTILFSFLITTRKFPALAHRRTYFNVGAGLGGLILTALISYFLILPSLFPMAASMGYTLPPRIAGWAILAGADLKEDSYAKVWAQAPSEHKPWLLSCILVWHERQARTGQAPDLRHMLHQAHSGWIYAGSMSSPSEMEVRENFAAMVEVLLHHPYGYEQLCAIARAELFTRSPRKAFLLDLHSAGLDMANWTEEGIPLHIYFLAHNEWNIFSLLLRLGFSPAGEDLQGNTALHWTAGLDMHRPFMDLVAQGLDPEAVNHDGMTPLHLAAIKNSQYLVKQLLGLGVSPNCQDRFGATPLHYLALRTVPREHLKALHLKEFINAQSSQEETPLMRLADVLHSGLEQEQRNALEFWHPDVLKQGWGYTTLLPVLGEAGARADLPDNQGMLPVHYAFSWYTPPPLDPIPDFLCEGILLLRREWKADASLTNIHGMTALDLFQNAYTMTGREDKAYEDVCRLLMP